VLAEPTGVGDGDFVPTITELIQTQRDATGETFRAMAARAAAAGHKIKYQQIQTLATSNPKGWPKYVSTIRALGVALQVNERTIVLAYAMSFGLDVAEGRSLLEVLLPAGTRDIDADLQLAIAGVARAAVAARHKDGDPRGDTAPTKQVEVVKADGQTHRVRAPLVKKPAPRPRHADDTPRP
jgi:hypothetical protein